MEQTASFGYWLRRRRKALDLTQEALAQQAGCTAGMIRRIEADERRPSRELAEHLARCLAIPPDERAAFIQAARAELATDRIEVVQPPIARHDVAELPAGTVTFLFTDIESSTELWSRHPAAMRAALGRHDELLRDAIANAGGVVVKGTGDGMLAAFALATDALAAALSAQRACEMEDWGAIDALKVRMALHSGPAELRDGDYFGVTLNRAARLLAAGHGRQILLSASTWELVRDHLPPDVASRDLGSHWLKGLARPEQIYQLIAPDLTADFPPLATLNRPITNLPAQATPFIGREHESAALCELLRRADVRLVTLTGPGGTGKTRLAFQTAEALLDDFPDGVWFVNLAPLGDPALVASSIAQTFQLHTNGWQSLEDRLKDYLRDKQLLLLLDNFEQIVDAAPLVSDLLAAAHHLKVLVTSRIPLHLSGEHEYAVPPLPCPDLKHLPRDLERLTQYEAVHLFIERARAVKDDFAVTNDNAPAVAEICWRLDGLPLAIELAAARVKLFPPQALLARLGERLKFLVGGARDLPARQQTIRGTIDWSYHLLDEDERRLFARLSVFAGGCTLEAAETICGDGRRTTDDEQTVAEAKAIISRQSSIVDRIAALLDHSLLRQVEEPGGEPRFGMLETTREYALERLAASDEAEILRQRHAEYYLMLAETAEPELYRADQLIWLQRLEQELHNFRAALAWCQTSAAGVKIGLRLAGALGRFWLIRNHQSEGYVWLTSILASPTAEPSAERAKALNAAGFLIENLTQAKVLFEEALAIGRALGNSTCIADALRGLETAVPLADTALRQALLEESLELYQALGDTWRSAMAQYQLGFLAQIRGDFGQAIERCERSLALFKQLGDRWGIISSSRRLLDARALSTENFDEYIPQMNAIVAQWRELGDMQSCAGALNDLGDYTRCQGDYASAARYLAESLALSRELGNRPNIALVLCNQGTLAHNQGDDTQAAALMAESLALLRGAAWQEFIAYGLVGLGWVAMGQGRAERAARLLGAAKAPYDAAGSLSTPADRAEFDRTVAAARAQLGDEAFAAAWQAGQAMTLEQAIDYALETL